MPSWTRGTWTTSPRSTITAPTTHAKPQSTTPYGRKPRSCASTKSWTGSYGRSGDVVTALEQAARARWVGWGAYAKFTRCGECGGFLYCRARRYAGPWLCVDCHDQRG